MTELRTSHSHPLRVDWLPLGGMEVGLTFAPGKRSFSRYSPVQWRRDLSADVARLRNTHECNVLVSLIRDDELDRYQIASLYDELASAGIEVIRFPIRDADVPESDVETLVARILKNAAGGRCVVIHCIGGLGRTGVIAGCVLIRCGFHPSEALSLLGKLRGPRCPETEAQRRYVRAFGVWPSPACPAQTDQRLALGWCPSYPRKS